MNKEELYHQISKFNLQVTKEKETQSKKFYYIQDDVAIDKSTFIHELVQKDETFPKDYTNIIDLCYGSGNLTTHILLDGNINYKNLVLNDVNERERNNDILLGSKTSYDFLDASKFNSKYDMIVFNPQIGGSELGSVNFETNIKPIIFNGTIEDYLISEGIDITQISITQNKLDNSYLIYSEILNKSEMTNIFKDIKLFNYYDILYQTPNTKQEGIHSNIVRFRKTIENISNKNTVIAFFGEQKHFELLFADYTYIRHYIDGNIKQFFLLGKFENSKKCFVKNADFFEEVDCKNRDSSKSEEFENFDELDLQLNKCNFLKQEKSSIKNNGIEDINKLEFSNEEKGILDFDYKNILLKGVPGTGKSETIKNIIANNLDMKELAGNVLRINIHSASSNSDLMQGISISTTKDNENVLYREKQGAILNHIFKAIYEPKQPFVLVLEEIQENSLNELIGDLIYLIEDKKRTIVDLDIPNNTEIVYDELFDKINEKAKENAKSLDYVELPSLVENSQNNTKMIVPDNLFIFCTSNYRDDKKVIEDNLLRRFDVIEIYPKYDGIYKSEDIPKFLEKLNNQILEQFKDEIHPDRYLIGHANWLDIQEDSENSQIAFYKALLKVIIEFKEIREIDFDSEVKPILEKVFKDIKLISDRLERYLKIFYDDDKLELKSYKHIVDLLQKEIYKSFL